MGTPTESGDNKMIKKYAVRISFRFDCEAKITEVEVEKETDKSVWISGHRSAKQSTHANYYDTWEEAYRILLDRQATHVEGIRRTLERSNGILGNIKGIKPPCQPTE